jgi:putative Holliday junction resolvase
MRILAIDPGARRVGLAWADDLGVVLPVGALHLEEGDDAVDCIAAEVRRRGAETLVVGYPVRMDGTPGARAREVDALMERLRAVLPGVQVAPVDETLSTKATTDGMSLREERRTRLDGRRDAKAAAVILADYLAREFPPLLPDEEGGR